MKITKKALIFMKEIIFPPCCLICGKISKKYLCKECKNKLYEKAIFKISNCQDAYFRRHIYIFDYKEDIRDLILEYKFKDKSYLYKIFSEIIIKNEKICGNLKKYDIIVPVPIHKKRKQGRGYNQSALIARNIANNFDNLKYEEILIKIKNTPTQSSLSREERNKNVKNAYKLTCIEKIKNKKIVLLDDIYTTGFTSNECSRLLRENGAKEILVLTIAKDEI